MNGLEELSRHVSIWPPPEEMHRAGCRDLMSTVYKSCADNITLTARPKTFPWDGSLDVRSGWVVKRSKSTNSEFCLDPSKRKGVIKAKTLTDLDPERHGWVVQQFNPAILSWGEARLVFVNGECHSMTHTVPEGDHDMSVYGDVRYRGWDSLR
jgi:hypothetical protein